MRILVTGGAGFIGSHIVDRYIELGHEVFVIDNLSTGKKEYLNPKAKFFHEDVRNSEKIKGIFSHVKPEILNHHAAQMDVRKSVIDPINDAEVNILGLLNLMESGKKDLRQVIFASSGGTVYGNASKLPTPEDYRTKPSSPYGVSKLSSEYYLEYYYQQYNINYSCLRYGNVYGPRQNPHGEAGVIAIFTLKMLQDKQPIINGDGKQSRDFVYVNDIVDVNVNCLSYQEPIIINIGTGTATDINHIFDLLVKLTGSRFSRAYGPAKPGEQKTSVLDSSLAQKLLKWKTRINLYTGLSETVNFFKKNG